MKYLFCRRLHLVDLFSPILLISVTKSKGLGPMLSEFINQCFLKHEVGAIYHINASKRLGRFMFSDLVNQCFLKHEVRAIYAS